MHGKTNTFVNDDLLDNFTPQDITNDLVPINTNLTTTPPEGTHEPTTQHTLPDPNISTKTNALPIVRKTTRTTHTRNYLKDYNYTLPNLHSLTSFISHDDRVGFSSFCYDSQQLVKTISHECEPNSFEEAMLHPAWQQAMTQ